MLSVRHHITVVEVKRHEGTVFLQYAADLAGIEDLLCFFGKRDRDRRTTRGSIRIRDLIIHPVIRFPGYSRSILLEGFCIDTDLIRHHECGIETETEMSDDAAGIRALFLILLNEVHRAGESDLIDVLIDFLFRHTDTIIGKLDRSRLTVIVDMELIIICIFFYCFAEIHKSLKLGDRVRAVTDKFSYENILIGIQPFPDDRKDVFRSY